MKATLKIHLNFIGLKLKKNNFPLKTEEKSLINLKMFKAGEYHSLIVSEDKRLFSFGNNACGQLGLGNEKNENIPQLVESVENVKKIACGFSHSLVLRKYGRLFSFGHNENFFNF